MDFLWPFNVLALLLPFVVRYFAKPLPEQQDDIALRVPFFKAFQNQFRQSAHIKSAFSVLCFVSGFLALVIAAMRPVVYEQAINLPVNGRQLMLVLDVSGSMAEPDFFWNNK